ncbi:MAG: ribosomal protein L7/L12 [Bacteroidetes bacterium]|nr:ribosomal protein L7/L12 [Bacteroidota bacterium]
MTALPEHIAELIRHGRKIEAIKILREETGVDLKTAKEAVDRLDADPAFDPIPALNTEGISDDVLLLAWEGQLIPAIRLLREQSGLGLKEAKEIVEQLPVDPDLPQRNTGSVAVVVVIAVALLVMGIALAVFFAAV